MSEPVEAARSCRLAAGQRQIDSCEIVEAEQLHVGVPRTISIGSF